MGGVKGSIELMEESGSIVVVETRKMVKVAVIEAFLATGAYPECLLES